MPFTPEQAYISIGSNVGDSKVILLGALDELEKLSTPPILCSSFWRTSPVDCPPGSPPFLNAVVRIRPHPAETPETLLAKLQAIERAFGRRPKKVINEPRPLDLDIILFGSQTRSTPELHLPHPRAHQRLFVLVPLAEIAPNLIFPGQTQSVRDLLSELRARSREQIQKLA